MWFPNRSDTNRAVQAQKQATTCFIIIIIIIIIIIYLFIYLEEELYYPSSEIKGAGQLLRS